MNEQNNNGKPDIPTIAEIIQEIEEKSADKEEYIYRGEREYHTKISSSLYRDYEKKIDTEDCDMREVQKERLSEVKQHINERDILTPCPRNSKNLKNINNLMGF